MRRVLKFVFVLRSFPPNQKKKGTIISVTIARHIDMTANLSTGAIRRMFNNEQPGSGEEPYAVQVIDLKQLPNNQGGSVRHRLIISDGVHFMQAMLATQLNAVVGSTVRIHSRCL